MYDELLKAGSMLASMGYSADIIDVRTIKPLDPDLIRASAARTGRVLVAENAIRQNGLGNMVENLLSHSGIRVPVVRVGVGDHPLCQGKIAELMHQEGMDAGSVFQKAVQLIQNDA